MNTVINNSINFYILYLSLFNFRFKPTFLGTFP